MVDMVERSPRVLVVEDDHVYQRLLELALKRLGCRCNICSDGRSALDAITSTPYDLAIVAIHIPEVDGFMVACLLREMGCTLPLVAISAIVLEGIERKAKAVGFDAFLCKPFDDAQIDQLLGRYVRIKATN